MQQGKPQLAVDFDGTLNTHRIGFEDDASKISDGPIDGQDGLMGALAALREYVQFFDVIIFSARAQDPAGVDAIGKWLSTYGVGDLPVTITDVKPPYAIMYLDDLGWRFDGIHYPSAVEILAATPWWQQRPGDVDLPPIEGKTVGQLTACLLQRAEDIEPSITNIMLRTILAAGGKPDGLDDRLKTESSIEGKLQQVADEKSIDLVEAAADIKDTVRYTSVIGETEYTDGVYSTLMLLEGNDLKVIRNRNYWQPQSKSRYSDGTYLGINVVLQTLNGFMFELQFHTPASLKAQLLNRHAYEAIRSATLSPAERDDIERSMLANNEIVAVPPGASVIKAKMAEYSLARAIAG